MVLRLGPPKNICWFPVTRPTLILTPTLRNFIGLWGKKNVQKFPAADDAKGTALSQVTLLFRSEQYLKPKAYRVLRACCSGSYCRKMPAGGKNSKNKKKIHFRPTYPTLFFWQCYRKPTYIFGGPYVTIWL